MGNGMRSKEAGGMDLNEKCVCQTHFSLLRC